MVSFICIFIFIYFSFLLDFNNVSFTGARVLTGDFSAEESPFTPKAFLIRYWNKQIRSDLPKSSFVLSKASPLTAVDSASFTKLAKEYRISTQLPAFCSSANLFCFPDTSESISMNGDNANSKVYIDKNFTNYGTNGQQGKANSFQNYSSGPDNPRFEFQSYSRDSVAHDDRFKTYDKGENLALMRFNTYGKGSTGGFGNFKQYQEHLNVGDNRFNSYSDGSNGRAQTFKEYSKDSNAADPSFSSYGNETSNDFTSYAKNTAVGEPSFKNYGDNASKAADRFTNYGENGNIPVNKFNNYGDGGNGAVDDFSNYRQHWASGRDIFTSYAKNSKAAKVNFNNYGQSFNDETFTGYGEKASVQKIGFQTYRGDTPFKTYAKTGVTFDNYNVSSDAAKTSGEKATEMDKTAASGKSVNRGVEPGKFFRETMLKEGAVMPMPDIKDKMPQRSFLPRSIISKLPFSTSKIKQIFHAGDDSSMETIILDALKDCESG